MIRKEIALLKIQAAEIRLKKVEVEGAKQEIIKNVSPHICARGGACATKYII